MRSLLPLLPAAVIMAMVSFCLGALSGCDSPAFQPLQRPAQVLTAAGIDPKVALANACESWASAEDQAAARIERGEIAAKDAMQIGAIAGDVRKVCKDQAHAGEGAVAIVGDGLVRLAGLLLPKLG